MRMEQSQIVQSFDCSEWLCQWRLLKGQTCGLIFNLVLFVHLNGALVHNIKWYFSLMHHFEQFEFRCIATSCSLRTTMRNLSSDTLLIFHPHWDILLQDPVLITILLPVIGGLLLSQSVSVHIIKYFDLLAECECLSFSFITILSCCLSSYFLSPFLEDCCRHFRCWRGTRHWCRYGWNLIFWLCLTPSHTTSLPAFLCSSLGQRYIPQNSIYIS